MILPIRSADGTVQEWALVELQGKVESTDADDPTVREIGTLQLSDQDKGVVQLVIGYHQLEGKKIPLKKPFVILEKVVETEESAEGSVHYEAVGVVRSKLLFKTRPTALISKPRR